jgi:hypothetical protein
VHVVCESVTRQTGEAGWALSGPFWRSLPNSNEGTLSKKSFPLKKSSQIGYTKNGSFLILSKMKYMTFFH